MLLPTYLRLSSRSLTLSESCSVVCSGLFGESMSLTLLVVTRLHVVLVRLSPNFMSVIS